MPCWLCCVSAMVKLLAQHYLVSILKEKSGELRWEVYRSAVMFISKVRSLPRHVTAPFPFARPFLTSLRLKCQQIHMELHVKRQLHTIDSHCTWDESCMRSCGRVDISPAATRDRAWDDSRPALWGVSGRKTPQTFLPFLIFLFKQANDQGSERFLPQWQSASLCSNLLVRLSTHHT